MTEIFEWSYNFIQPISYNTLREDLLSRKFPSNLGNFNLGNFNLDTRKENFPQKVIMRLQIENIEVFQNWVTPNDITLFAEEYYNTRFFALLFKNSWLKKNLKLILMI